MFLSNFQAKNKNLKINIKIEIIKEKNIKHKKKNTKRRKSKTK